jgi:signal transduction histidine kinase
MGSAGRPRFSMGLSARLLLLTVFFIMLSEFLIYAPSIGRYRKVYLEEVVTRAHLATLTLDPDSAAKVNAELEQKVLAEVGAHGIMLIRPDRRVLAVSKDMPPAIDATFDLREGGFMVWIRDAIIAQMQNENRVLRVLGSSPRDPGVTIEVVLDETPLRRSMYGYSSRIVQLSIFIALITAGLLFLSLQWLTVRPMRRITETLTAFRKDPENEERTIVASHRTDEVGVAQRELAIMQDQVRAALRQKTRLATLGAAVAKINHDLRNTLATAVLVSDRLADSDDPEVKRMTPRLYDAIDRAVQLCSHTLNYVADSAPPLRRAPFPLHDLVEESGSAVLLAEPREKRPEWRNGVPTELEVSADREQLFRVLNNLGHNACQAGAATLEITAQDNAESVTLDIIDDGPGLTPRARESLFQPFAGSTRAGGSGLGLVIARDIMRAHGGDIALLRSGEGGTTFRLTLPTLRRAG